MLQETNFLLTSIGQVTFSDEFIPLGFGGTAPAQRTLSARTVTVIHRPPSLAHSIQRLNVYLINY